MPPVHNIATPAPVHPRVQVGFYNLLAQNRVRRRFGFDIVVAKNGTRTMNEACDFFQQVRHRPDLRKGIVRLKL